MKCDIMNVLQRTADSLVSPCK